MNERGVTLVELLAGLVAATIIGAASAGILKAGIMTYTHSVRQNDSLTRTRKAIGGEGAAAGILRTSRPSATVSALNAGSVVVLSTSAVESNYYTNGGNLYLTKGGVGGLHADKITTIAVNYYNMNASGLIIESTSAASAVLVTTLVTVKGQTSKQKDYTLFSGATLRNHANHP